MTDMELYLAWVIVIMFIVSCAAAIVNQIYGDDDE